MELKQYLNDNKTLIESHLALSLQDSKMPDSLRDAMAYSLNAGGKRIRPILVLASAQAVGRGYAPVMPTAIALEMIHTFSLIHDDLPSMDDDDLRRGKPTNHKVYGEANAILAGDGLLAEAFYLLAVHNPEVNPAQQLEVIMDIAHATGARGMTGGQVIDMDSTGKAIDIEMLTKLHAYKTGALLRVSCTSGAMLLGAHSDDIHALRVYGDSIGLAFQIADDILDVEGDQELLGKDIGSDQGNEKSTFPALIGMDASKKRAKELVQIACDSVSRFEKMRALFQDLAHYIIERNQ